MTIILAGVRSLADHLRTIEINPEAYRPQQAAHELRQALPKIEHRPLEEYAVLFKPHRAGDPP